MADSFKVFNPVKELDSARNFSCVLVSPRRAGKTFMMKYLLYAMKSWFSAVYVFSGTADVQQGNPYDFCPESNIYQGLDVDKINEIYEAQTKRSQQCQECDIETPLILLVFDDVINEDVNIRYVNSIKKIFSKGRHLNIAIIILNQYFTALPPVVRANCDFVGCQRLTTKDDKTNFVRAYLSIESDKEGIKILKDITNTDYQFLIVNLIKRSYQVQDFVFKLIAEKVPKFLIEDKVAKMPEEDLIKKIKEEEEDPNRAVIKPRPPTYHARKF